MAYGGAPKKTLYDHAMAVIYQHNPDESRSWPRAMARGFRKKCPRCGKGNIFNGYIKNHHKCPQCDLDLSGHRADDAPPYITIMIVGHTIIPLALALRQFYPLSLSLQFAIWLPIMLLMTYDLLPRSKGTFIGLQWAHFMHGFGIQKSTE